MAQVLHLPALNRSSSSLLLPLNLPRLHSHPHLLRSNPCPVSLRRLSNPSLPLHQSSVSLSPFVCNFNGSDIIPPLEIEKPEQRRRPEKRVNGVFWIILLNLGIFVADHILQVRAIKSLYLYHNWPAWYQFITAAFCHANWNHLSSNLFFLYIFGKLVEEEEGNLALWLSYILTGAGANLVSWLVLPRNAVSVGASGAVFGLFAISVLVKMSWDWRKILEVLILGQFVIDKVMEAAQASAGMSNGLVGGFPLQSVNHIAHLSGALVGVFLVWLLSITPSPSETDHKRNTNTSASTNLITATNTSASFVSLYSTSTASSMFRLWSNHLHLPLSMFLSLSHKNTKLNPSLPCCCCCALENSRACFGVGW